jgi:hypothetical protein
MPTEMFSGRLHEDTDTRCLRLPQRVTGSPRGSWVVLLSWVDQPALFGALTRTRLGYRYYAGWCWEVAAASK